MYQKVLRAKELVPMMISELTTHTGDQTWSTNSIGRSCPRCGGLASGGDGGTRTSRMRRSFKLGSGEWCMIGRSLGRVSDGIGHFSNARDHGHRTARCRGGCDLTECGTCWIDWKRK